MLIKLHLFIIIFFFSSPGLLEKQICKFLLLRFRSLQLLPISGLVKTTTLVFFFNKFILLHLLFFKILSYLYGATRVVHWKLPPGPPIKPVVSRSSGSSTCPKPIPNQPDYHPLCLRPDLGLPRSNLSSLCPISLLTMLNLPRCALICLSHASICLLRV